MAGRTRRVGIVGFGAVGQRLAEAVLRSDSTELAFVWNRTRCRLEGKVPADVVLDSLAEFSSRQPDLVVEVSHPSVVKDYGKLFLQSADLMIGSTNALADPCLEKELRAAANHHGIYIPSGPLWGGEDIKKMADAGTLAGLKVTMKKHPASLKLEGELKTRNAAVQDTAVTLYEGPAREVCRLAPQNTNTMCTAALLGLGLDRTVGRLVADPSLTDYHLIEVEVWGKKNERGTCFYVHTLRKNPATVGAVSGSATYDSFVTSLFGAKDKGSGVHLC